LRDGNRKDFVFVLALCLICLRRAANGRLPTMNLACSLTGVSRQLPPACTQRALPPRALVFQDSYYDLIFTLDAKSAVKFKVVNEGNKPTKWLVPKDLVKHLALCSDATSAFSQRCLDIHNRLREVARQGLVDSSSLILGSPGWIFPPPFAALDGLCPRPEDARLLMLSIDLPMTFKHDDLRNPLALTANVLSTADGLESYIASHNNDVKARFATIVREKRRQIALLRDRTKFDEATKAVLSSDYFFLDLRLCCESNNKHIQGRTPDQKMVNIFFQGLHADLDVIEHQLNAVASTISKPDIMMRPSSGQISPPNSDAAIQPSLDVEPVLTSPHSADPRSMGRLAQLALCFCAAAALIVTAIYAVTRANSKLDVYWSQTAQSQVVRSARIKLRRMTLTQLLHPLR